MSYTPSFTPQYADGWEDLPLETTPITAEALNKYDDAIENIETYLSENDIVDANANIADEYDATATYSKDDYVIYGGNLYKAKQDISTAEAWDSTHWDACIVTDEMSQGDSLAELSDIDLENLADGDIIRYNGTSGKFENVAKEVYSTDEQVIGKWIDGSTLYRKVIDFGALPNATRKNVAHGISNLGRVCKFDCTAIDTANAIGFPPPMPISLNNTTSNLIVIFDATNISFNTGGNLSNYTDCKAILEYTKTS